MTEGTGEERLRRRLTREHSARREAEAIAERVTGELYAAVGELERLNRDLEIANRSIKEFVGVASHDIRGPLTVIIASAQLLKDNWDDIPAHTREESLAGIMRQGLRLNRLVEDLLTVSRLESGSVEAHVQEISLALELERIIHDIGDDAEKIHLNAPSDLRVNADPDHLERILFNYLTNAIKYGAPPIEACAKSTGDFVELRIRDHGNGVPADFVPRLFAKFARAEDPDTPRRQGTGLGLSIVLGLARANGGDAWYEPNDPRGSCFAVKLPQARLP